MRMYIVHVIIEKKKIKTEENRKMYVVHIIQLLILLLHTKQRVVDV